ncbi:MAG: PAS domain-containing protein [Phycisphaerales bacterium]|nr:PAS domain-containing protein [Phycisphaerales bacterium]
MKTEMTLTGNEQFFQEDDLIVSKTDTKGRIIYANQTFLRIADFKESEVIGQAHNIIRHPSMPRCVFRFLWERIEAGHEVFAYVVNRCKNGDHYWVFAHVTPTFGQNNRIVGYHSSRRVPKPEALNIIKPLYAELLAIEAKHYTPREQWQASLPVLVKKLEGMGLSYDEFIFKICA